MDDMIAKGRGTGFVGVNNPGAKLSEKAVITIYESRERQDSLAVKYGVDNDTISKIKCCHSWREITQGLVRGDAFTQITEDMRKAISADPRRQVDVAKDYGIWPGTVSAIKRSYRLKEVEE
jgi:hypothetical protein